MRIEIERVGIDQTTIDETMDAITNGKVLNAMVERYVRDRMNLDSDLMVGFDPQEDTDRGRLYWELYALRTKEVVIAALCQL